MSRGARVRRMTDRMPVPCVPGHAGANSIPGSALEVQLHPCFMTEVLQVKNSLKV
jgi:hypothetical protein